MVKVIGIGNRLMKDDGIAISVLENIEDRLESYGIGVILAETDVESVFHQLQEKDFVIIIDAMHTGGEVGRIHSYERQEAIAAYGEDNTQHDRSIFDLMKLYSKTFRGCLIGIEITEVKYGCELSGAITKNYEAICNEVENIIIENFKEAF